MIRLIHANKTYTKGVRAVKDLSLKISDGEFVFIAGRSGSGKSTVIKLLTGEVKPTDGLVEVNGTVMNKIKRRELPQYRRHLGVVFQDFRLLNDRNVFENVAFAQRVIGVPAEKIKENVAKILQLTGLSAKYRCMPEELSGGEQQRVAIARALVNQPDIILADEPTGNLDEKNTEDIMRLLTRINEMGTTVVVITHNRNLLTTMGKRVIHMEKGSIVGDYPTGLRGGTEL